MELIILHSNDTHGHLFPLPDAEGTSLGGYSRRATFIQQQRACHPHLLLLDAGDFYQGSRYWHLFKGEPDITLMNHLRYDAATLGNHDCDEGLDLLVERLEQATFPVLGANIILPDHLSHLVQPYIIKEVNGIRIAIMGLTIDMVELYPPEFNQQVQFRSPLETAQELLPRLKSEADLIILLSHLGHETDVALAQALPDLDIIIGGHSHTALPAPLWIQDTAIVRGVVGTQFMGRLQFEITPAQTTLVDYQLLPLDATLPDDPVITEELDQWQAKIPPAAPIGYLNTVLDIRNEIKGQGESAAGNLFVDAQQAYFAPQVQLSFVHMGTLRGDRCYGPGEFTDQDLSEYHPFPSYATLMDITAPQLKIMLERGVSMLPLPISVFLSQTGLIVTADLKKQPQIIDVNTAQILTSGQRIVRAEYQGQPIDFKDESLIFRVVMDGYMGRGGAGYFITRQAQNIQHTEISGREIIAWYFKHYSPLSPHVEGRIIIHP